MGSVWRIYRNDRHHELGGVVYDGPYGGGVHLPVDVLIFGRCDAARRVQPIRDVAVLPEEGAGRQQECAEVLADTEPPCGAEQIKTNE